MGEIDRLYREAVAQNKRLREENERLRALVDDPALADTIKLGRWVQERGDEFTNVAHRNLIWIAYAETGVKRP